MSVEKIIQDLLEKNYGNMELQRSKEELKENNDQPMSSVDDKNEMKNQINSSLLSLQLPSYLTAYYSTLQRKNNMDTIANCGQNSNHGNKKLQAMTNPLTTSIFNHLRNPFFYQLPKLKQSFV